MSDRIAEAFASHGKRAALMPYLMGGHPTIEESGRSIAAAADAGADLVELGIPYSDPLADGPVIQAAGTAALDAGVRPDDVLALCEQASARLPVVLMVYSNLVLAHGGEDFVRRAHEAGAAGLIVPDLPHDEAAGVRAACRTAGLALVPLAAPTTPADRLRAIAADAQGFVYAVSVVGTTGERDDVPAGLPELIARVRGATDLPVAVGFGISTEDQARTVGDLADGVIVGSRVVRAADEQGAEGVREVVGRLARALAL